MGWNQPTAKQTSQHGPGPRSGPSRSRQLCLMFVLAALGIAGTVAVMRFRRPAEKTPQAAVEKPSAPTPIAVKKPATTRPGADAKPVAPVAAEADSRRLYHGVEIVSSTVSTNMDGAVVERLVLANGEKARRITPPKPVFANPSDQMIAMALSVREGQMMPPLPENPTLERDFAESLKQPIVIEDGDSESVKELKAGVIEARAYLAEQVSAGKSVRQALEAYQGQMNVKAQGRLQGIQEVERVRQEEGDEAAAQYARRINKVFKMSGIPEISERKSAARERKEAK